MDERILFYGTPEFAVGCLDYLRSSGVNIIGVVTAPDKKSGRGRKLNYSPIKKYALSQNIPIFQPINLKSIEFQQTLEKLQPDIQVVVAFRMLPKQVWSFPPKGTLNLHSSLLPNYRGAAPINWVLINGEKKTGVTTFMIDEKIDTGQILLQKTIKILPQDTFSTLYPKVLEHGKILLAETIRKVISRDIIPIEQITTGYEKKAPKLTSENTRINWDLPLIKIERLVRGLEPNPGAWTFFDNGQNKNLRMKILRAEIKTFESHEKPYQITINQKKMLITHHQGHLQCKYIQLEGKKTMDVKSLLNGYTFLQGSKVL